MQALNRMGMVMVTGKQAIRAIPQRGRGEMVEEAALKWALDEGIIRGAGIDMLESEDPDLSKCVLIEDPPRKNLIINPHSGYWSDTSDYLVRKYSMENAMNYVNGNFDAVHDIRNGVRK